jgi:hypothetical protein
VIRRTLSVLSAALVAFHVWLLGDQIWRGALTDPALLLRWALAAGLIGAVVALRRRGISLVWGRRAVAVWSLAALLHGPAVLDRSRTIDADVLPEVTAVLTQLTGAVAVAFGLAWLRALLWRGTRATGPVARVVSDREFFESAHFDGCIVQAPRPPPLA